MSDKIQYDAYDYGDRLETGKRIDLVHFIRIKNPYIANLVSHTADDLEKMRIKSANNEEMIFSELRQAFGKWEEQAAQTQLLDKAIQYVKTPTVKHTGNHWTTDEYGWHNVSNAVYRMYYRIWENKRYDPAIKKEITLSYELSWGVHVQDPGNSQNSGRIAGQERKRFAEKTTMEKYMQGRIKAYAHLFEEISPPIPTEYVNRFCVNGLLLPGYTAESEQKKESVLGQLAKAKARTQEQFRKGNDFNQPPYLSPWGEIKTSKKLCAGVFQVTAGEHNGIMVANEVVAVLSPLTCKHGEERGGFLCFEDKDSVICDLASKKLLNAEQNADKAIAVKKSKQEAER